MSERDEVLLAKLPLEEILVRRKGLKRRLSARGDLRTLRIAVLSGSTTQEVVELMELWLLDSGFSPVFYQSEYGRFDVDAVHDVETLRQFKPDLVYVHTSVYNVRQFAPVGATEAELDRCVELEMDRFRMIWDSLERNLGCTIVQNNFELPELATLGNLDATLAGGRTRLVNELNRAFALAANSRPKLTVQDVAGISARVGLERWFDRARWFRYKLVTTPEGSNALARSFAAICRGLYGKARKVLVLDLDDTLWGGVIGDDGVDRLQIGRETAVAEAYTAFQEYCLRLRQRGVLLAVCSKNDEATAKSGFEHPDSVLRLEHFASFRANWQPKHENIEAIAAELNLGWDSFVFVDDNPAERALVEAQLPGIAVPEIGDDVALYPVMIEAGRYFESVALTEEDAGRATFYACDSMRAGTVREFADYEAYLDSLEMSAEIEPFKPVYLERITQLTNKTNQFNLTGRRYTQAEMEAVMGDRNAVALYGRLSDRFGDNGLVSIVVGKRCGEALEIELWLMSCRVLKRGMELAMLDVLVERAQELGVKSLRGVYLPTRKNAMVADHYAKLGFQPERELVDGAATYTLELKSYARRNRHIRVHELALAGE